MKKVITLLAALMLVLTAALPVYAADGNVIYSGNAGEFIFIPGTEDSVSDLFPNFKEVMPGDTLTQKITVRNDADNKVKVKIYMRSLGSHKHSEEFLSQLHMTVSTGAGEEMAYMFDAAADETAQLTDWVCLGTLYSGGEVNLDVVLTVPVELGNEFQDQLGHLDWEFMVEEYPVEPEDPRPPHTGDDFPVEFWIVLLICSGAMLLFLLLWRKKKEENRETI